MTTRAGSTAVVTGIGVVSSLGRDLTETFEALCAGKSGLTRPTPELAEATNIEVVSQAPDINPTEVLKPPIDPGVDRYLVLAMAAAEQAVRDAGLTVGENSEPERTAVVASTAGGALRTYEEHAAARRERGRQAVSPYLCPGMIPNMSAARIAIKYGIRGYSLLLSTACAGGGQALAEALRLIRAGDADVVVCGGSDAPLHPTVAAAFVNANSLAHGYEDPARASRPFDRDRNGYVLGEGAAFFVVERAEHADARKAAGYADLIGWGATTDAYHVTKPRPDGSGAAECMRRAIASAGLGPRDIGYINAHATSTGIGDVAEARAIRSLFGEETPPVSSTKSITGHLMGASGSFEAAATVLAVAHGTLPPTHNLDTVAPHCELNHVCGKPLQTEVRAALSNSFGFGGHNISLAFGAPSTRGRRVQGAGADD
ncbi:beta-ketoacyl-[acyl-carrier-protein] synthase family protein [Streptomyces sp. NPDC046197]|uniref:beta-ketoacyl-[acyl-carrier-protein] synthase family protein n=1 Tax=Streptomyces sp. NPDC046197 TaxID=3154337 RepID=UPI0033C7F4F6